MVCIGLVEEAVLPYSDVAPGEQTTVEQMKDIVCVQERRPPLADQWSLDEVGIYMLRYTLMGKDRHDT